MITNDRQYKISRIQFNKIRDAISGLDSNCNKSKLEDKALIEAQLNALKSEQQILNEQILEYESLKAGEITNFKAETLSDLYRVLIRARIAKGLSQRDLANLLGLKEQQIQRYEAEMYATASLRRLSAVAEALDLRISEIAELNSRQDKPGIDWKQFPIAEMYKRNWFEDFRDSLDAAIMNGAELAKDYCQSVYPQLREAFTRKHIRSDSSLDNNALYAWQCRIAVLAKGNKIKQPYDKGTITASWLGELAKLSKKKNGTREARNYLESAGIQMIIEPHLPRTYLDGAAMLLPDGSPVIGLTIRYDRVDNFWFVLFHELAHLTKHLKRGKADCYFDDLDADPDVIEDEADNFANEMLIPNAIWELSIARYVHTEDAVKELAAELRISPAIIAGRIRKETNKYTILTDLLGQNTVRTQFPEVNF